MCYCPTPTLHLLSPHRRRCISTFPQKTHSEWFISIFNYGGHWKYPHKSPSPCNTYVIPMSLYKFCVLINHINMPHTHTHTHTTHTTHTYTPHQTHTTHTHTPTPHTHTHHTTHTNDTHTPTHTPTHTTPHTHAQTTHTHTPTHTPHSLSTHAHTPQTDTHTHTHTHTHTCRFSDDIFYLWSCGGALARYRMH